MRLSKRGWLKWPALVYVEVIRGTPLLMVIFWFYFFAPILLGRAVPETESAIAAFIVFTRCLRGRDRPRRRAGHSQGPDGSRSRFGSFPRADHDVRHLAPVSAQHDSVLRQQFVSLTKDTSLAMIINVNELTLSARHILTRTREGAH